MVYSKLNRKENLLEYSNDMIIYVTGRCRRITVFVKRLKFSRTRRYKAIAGDDGRR